MTANKNMWIVLKVQQKEQSREQEKEKFAKIH